MKRKIRWVLTGLCALVFVFSLWNIISTLREYQAAEDIYDAVEHQVFAASARPVPSPTESAPSGTEAPSDEEEKTEETWSFSLDLAALQAVNRDVAGWIYLPDSKISYPFVQGKDNDEYLHRTYRRTQNASGSIFMDYRCEKDLSGQNTVLYGHYMKNGTMFGGLARFKDRDYWENHRYFYLLTQDGIHRYEVFACAQVEADAFCYQTSFANEDAFQLFLRQIEKADQLKTGVAPEADGKILTLSTCAAQDRTLRFVVFAMLA
ncbi:MAG: class B sortase [Oscillospiraceae bacterium]|jgi:sortase B